jgi:hypothetical protein
MRRLLRTSLNAMTLMCVAAIYAPLVHGTTVVVIVTASGIVIGSDGQMTEGLGEHRPLRGQLVKTILVQDHIAITGTGLENASNGQITAYDFRTWMERVQETLPPNISVESFVAVVERESAQVFIGFDVMLTRGVYRQKDPLENCEGLIQYVIVGYDNRIPRVFVVQYYIDWTRKTLIGPKRHVIHPQEGGAVDFAYGGFGVTQALAGLTNPKSFAYKHAMAHCPAEFKVLLARGNLSLAQSDRLVRTLVDVEKQTNPEAVGGHTAVVTIPPYGAANIVVYPEVARPPLHQRQSH